MIHFTDKKTQCQTLFISSVMLSRFSIALFFLAMISITSNSLATINQPISNDPTLVIKSTLKKITAFSTTSRALETSGSSANSHRVAQLRNFIEKQIIPNFDFDNMSHWITGRFAKNMTEQDKIDFKRNLRETFLSSLAQHLGSFDAQNTRIQFHRARYRGDDEAFASATIYRPDRLPVRLDFRMRQAGKTWKIIDIRANGSSAVLYYRRHFMSQLRQYQNLNQTPYQQRY